MIELWYLKILDILSQDISFIPMKLIFYTNLNNKKLLLAIKRA